MPAQPACFHRLDEIFTALRAMTSTHLDRQEIEKLFRVRQRRARQIMAGLEGLRVGPRRRGSEQVQEFLGCSLDFLPDALGGVVEIVKRQVFNLLNVRLNWVSRRLRQGFLRVGL